MLTQNFWINPSTLKMIRCLGKSFFLTLSDSLVREEVTKRNEQIKHEYEISLKQVQHQNGKNIGTL